MDLLLNETALLLVKGMEEAEVPKALFFSVFASRISC